MGEHRNPNHTNCLVVMFKFCLIPVALVGRNTSSAEHIPSCGSGRALYGFSSKGGSFRISHEANSPRNKAQAEWNELPEEVFPKLYIV